MTGMMRHITAQAHPGIHGGYLRAAIGLYAADPGATCLSQLPCAHPAGLCTILRIGTSTPGFDVSVTPNKFTYTVSKPKRKLFRGHIPVASTSTGNFSIDLYAKLKNIGNSEEG